ncbi:MAG: hypothetical protein HXX11_02510 [Desulfuromonadales bacterium]|nr:hypothetical protein [Desulfuromonadales bacterium]
MKIGSFLPAIILIVLIPAYFSTLTSLSSMNKRLPHADEVNVILPSPILKITSLDFDGLASDTLYLKALVFYGSTYENKKRRKMEEWEINWMSSTLKASTDLDPYFLDPYFLANSVLTWEANRVYETIVVLEKGCRYRDWDYWLPFLVGFNYYYFLKDDAKAAEYLMQASYKPGADPFFGFFAARLAYKSNRTENAIVFLEGMLNTTKDETMRKDYETRLVTLKEMLDLEKAAAIYKERMGIYPVKVSDLIEQRIIDRMPVEPYGGVFYFDRDGKVKTTSDLRYVTKQDSTNKVHQ